MPLYINESSVIERITFDKPVAEPEIRVNPIERILTALWRLIMGV